MPRREWGSPLTRAVTPIADAISRRKEWDRRKSDARDEEERQIDEQARSLAQIHGGQPAYYEDLLKAGESPERIRADAEAAKQKDAATREKNLNQATEVDAIARQINPEVGPPRPQAVPFNPDDLAKQLKGEQFGPQYGPTLPTPEDDFYGDLQKAYPDLSVSKARAAVSLDDMVKSAARLDPMKSQESHRQRLVGTPQGKRAATRDHIMKQNPGASPTDIDQMLAVMEMSGVDPTASFLQGPSLAQQKQEAQDELLAQFSDDEVYSPKELSGMGLTASESIKYAGMKGSQIKDRMLNGEPSEGRKPSFLQEQYDIILRNKGLKPGSIEYATEFVKMGARDEDKQVPSDAVIASTYKSLVQGLLGEQLKYDPAATVTPQMDSTALSLTQQIVTGMGTAAEKLGGDYTPQADSMKADLDRLEAILKDQDEKIKQLRQGQPR